ncbi:MAG TPA: pyruvate carboxylase, partial [Gordonia sp. (in: high G+C Gram-positive bacteria)]|nr:pyruvate carboxylase [Gordonia sp. (in: high G+C Gram-positive bacteria)]
AEAPAPKDLSEADSAALDVSGRGRQETLNRLLFPGPTREFEDHQEQFGDTSRLSANQFFYGLRYGEEHRVELEPGHELIIGLEAISDADEKGMRTVMCVLNGQLRPVAVRDRSVDAEVPSAEKADRTNPNHIAAPFAGVVSLSVGVGDVVAAGAAIGTIEAMKMEATITTPVEGKVTRVAIGEVAQVAPGDLLIVLG